MTPAVEDQPRRVRRRKRRSTSAPATSGDGRARLRSAYFSGAALWGFLTGTGAILVGLSLVDTPFKPGPGGMALLAGAAVVALVGGLIAAAAYRQASRRR